MLSVSVTSKKWVTFLAFLFCCTVAQATSVTQQQVIQAKKGSVDLITASQQMLQYTTAIGSLFQNNFQVAIAGSTITVTISGSTQSQVIDVATYNALKQQLINAFNELP